MKRPFAILLLCLLFSTGFTLRKAPGGGVSAADSIPDSLRSVYLYTEGIKRSLIDGDTTEAKRLYRKAVALDPRFAPAYYELAGNEVFDHTDSALLHARRAHELDTLNKWYLQLYGQLLVMNRRYDEALTVYRRLLRRDPKNPDNYRMLAMLYEQAQRPFSAIAVLDSAEVRFGRIPLLGDLKRHLLVSTRQYDKALAETQALVDAAPYEIEHRVALGQLYGAMKRDSAALVEFQEAMRIDSTNVEMLMAFAEFYNERHDYRNFLAVSKRLYESDEVPLDEKISRFEALTSDVRFYSDYYFQINDIASSLIIRYPEEKRVIELYATHLISTGQLDQALELYKLHTHDTPPDKSYFRMVIDIESYKQRPDSVDLYVSRALELFPGDPELYIARGHVKALAGEAKEAEKSYKKAIGLSPTDTLKGEIWGYIGDLHQRSGKMKKCYAAYERALKLHRDNASVLNNYAYFLSEENGVGRDLQRALEMSSRAIALTPGNSTYLDTYAWVLYRLERYAEAKKAMQQAISLDRRNSPELFLHYGDILSALGEKFIAEVYWRKALENGYEQPEEIERRIEAQKQQKPQQP